VEANARIMVSMSVALIAGPSLGGLLVQLLTAPVALAADAASFLASAFTVSRVHFEETLPPITHRKSLYREVRDGLTWLRSEPVLLRLTVCIGLANMSLYGVQAVIVVYATRDLGLEPAQLGLALGAMGPATLIGALVAGNVARRFGLGPTLIAALSGETISRFLILAAGGPPVIAMLWLGAAQLTFGFIAPLWDVNANSLRQSATPQHLLGRISAASAAIGVGLAPVGALLAGWIGEVAGPRAALLEAALVTLVSVTILVRSPVPGLRDPTGYLAQRAAKPGQSLS
jgi:predicted MFS family arabinose efflux permease